MLFVFNKDKITAYVITMCTVSVLFFMASGMTKREDIMITSVNVSGIVENQNNEDSNEFLNKN